MLLSLCVVNILICVYIIGPIVLRTRKAVGRLEIHPKYSWENIEEKGKMGHDGFGRIIMISFTLKRQGIAAYNKFKWRSVASRCLSSMEFI
jgi:hypothetical protein